MEALAEFSFNPASCISLLVKSKLEIILIIFIEILKIQLSERDMTILIGVVDDDDLMKAF